MAQGKADPVTQDQARARQGVVYLIFGGTHLLNEAFTLAQVGTASLPGIVFASPYEKGTADEAAPTAVGLLGDVDNDGFDDIGIGLPDADFLDPREPTQRRNDAGEAYIVYGNNFGTNSPATFSLGGGQ